VAAVKYSAIATVRTVHDTLCFFELRFDRTAAVVIQLDCCEQLLPRWFT
jgi:hypothetical protein